MYIEQNKQAFSHVAHLKALLDSYDFYNNKEKEKQLLNYINIIQIGMPLPSAILY